jgi:hypothetical protein
MSEEHALHQAFELHHSTAVMMLARSKIDKRPNDPYYGYRDLARYVHAGLAEPLDTKDVYLRLLACAKAERLPLPTIGHMQALMSMVWNENAIPSGVEQEFHRICHSVNEALCFEIGQFATDSMKALAATLRVDLQVHMGYQNEPSEPPVQAEVEKTIPLVTPDGKPTLH